MKELNKDFHFKTASGGTIQINVKDGDIFYVVYQYVSEDGTYSTTQSNTKQIAIGVTDKFYTVQELLIDNLGQSLTVCMYHVDLLSKKELTEVGRLQQWGKTEFITRFHPAWCTDMLQMLPPSRGKHTYTIYYGTLNHQFDSYEDLILGYHNLLYRDEANNIDILDKIGDEIAAYVHVSIPKYSYTLHSNVRNTKLHQFIEETQSLF